MDAAVHAHSPDRGGLCRLLLARLTRGSPSRRIGNSVLPPPEWLQEPGRISRNGEDRGRDDEQRQTPLYQCLSIGSRAPLDGARENIEPSRGRACRWPTTEAAAPSIPSIDTTRRFD